jgi:hypothetical protein
MASGGGGGEDANKMSAEGRSNPGSYETKLKKKRCWQNYFLIFIKLITNGFKY